MSEEKKHPELPPEKEHLDFLTSIILFIISVSAIVISIGYWKRSGEVFYASPGFMPVIIASCLVLMSVILFTQSLRGSSVSERCAQLAMAIPAGLRSHKVWRAAGGLAVFAVYIFLLLGRLPFWLASFLVLAATLLYLNGKKELRTILKLLLIAAGSIAAIVLLFQVAFSVPMP